MPQTMNQIIRSFCMNTNWCALDWSDTLVDSCSPWRSSPNRNSKNSAFHFWIITTVSDTDGWLFYNKLVILGIQESSRWLMHRLFSSYFKTQTCMHKIPRGSFRLPLKLSALSDSRHYVIKLVPNIYTFIFSFRFSSVFWNSAINNKCHEGIY